MGVDQVKRRKGRNKAPGTRGSPVIRRAPDLRWSLDFVSEVFAFGLVTDTSLFRHQVGPQRRAGALLSRRDGVGQSGCTVGGGLVRVEKAGDCIGCGTQDGGIGRMGSCKGWHRRAARIIGRQ